MFYEEEYDDYDFDYFDDDFDEEDDEIRRRYERKLRREREEHLVYSSLLFGVFTGLIVLFILKVRTKKHQAI